MYLTEYQRTTIDNFMGLWNRGSLDDIPVDHASDILNMAFARKRETITRPGNGFSHTMPGNSKVVRMFEAAFDNTTLIPLALDPNGNIWRLDTNAVILAIPGMIDFDALNMGNHVYIAPMVSTFQPNLAYIYVWASPSSAVRPAAGYPPLATFFTQAVGTGNVGPGWYGVAISYIYDTGYVTPPSLVVTQKMPGGTSLRVYNIPAPPPGVIGYLIFATKAQAGADDTQAMEAAQRAALYEVFTSYNIGSTDLTINFFDTDLIILASADPANGNLLNTLPRLPASTGYGSVALIKYHGRMIIIGPDIIYNDNDNVGAFEVVKDGRIFISHAGAQENFDAVTGFLVIQAEFDGNIPRTGFELFSVLYICKAVGTFSTQDNLSEPNDPTNPWVVNMIDGGIGAYHHAVGTISGSQPSLSFNSTAFLANRDGLFLFNGNVLRPELTWKIRSVWSLLTVGQEAALRLTIDIFSDLFYILMPVTSAELGPILLLVGDYSLGLDSNNIRWSIYKFPFPVYDILMTSWPDPVPAPSFYYLRMGSLGNIYRLDGTTLHDQVWLDGALSYNAAIDNYYQSAPLVPGGLGALNITRFVRYRMAGTGTLFTTLYDQGEARSLQTVQVNPDPFPGNYKDIGLQTNFTNEKVIVKFEMNLMDNYVRMARLDIFGKERWPTRPNA